MKSLIWQLEDEGLIPRPLLHVHQEAQRRMELRPVLHTVILVSCKFSQASREPLTSLSVLVGTHEEDHSSLTWALYSLNSALKIAEIAFQKLGLDGLLDKVNKKMGAENEASTTYTVTIETKAGNKAERCIEKIEYAVEQCLGKPVHRNEHTESTGTAEGGEFGAPGVTHSRNHFTEEGQNLYLQCHTRQLQEYTTCYAAQKERDFTITMEKEVKNTKQYLQIGFITLLNAAIIAVDGVNTEFTLAPSNDQYWYTQAIFLNMQKFQLWSGNAFDTMNDNVNSQIGVS